MNFCGSRSTLYSNIKILIFNKLPLSLSWILMVHNHEFPLVQLQYFCSYATFVVKPVVHLCDLCCYGTCAITPLVHLRHWDSYVTCAVTTLVQLRH